MVCSIVWVPAGRTGVVNMACSCSLAGYSLLGSVYAVLRQQAHLAKRSADVCSCTWCVCLFELTFEITGGAGARHCKGAIHQQQWPHHTRAGRSWRLRSTHLQGRWAPWQPGVYLSARRLLLLLLLRIWAWFYPEQGFGALALCKMGVHHLWGSGLWEGCRIHCTTRDSTAFVRAGSKKRVLVAFVWAGQQGACWLQCCCRRC